MPSQYALVQFHPDPSADERVDIGVVAWDTDGAHVVFIEGWERVPAVSMEEARLLRDFAESVRARLSYGIDLLIDEARDELIEDLVASSGLGVRLTPPKSASEDASTLISSLAARFRYPSPPKAKRGRDRRVAASHAYKAISDAVRERLPVGSRALVKAHRTLAGKFGEHPFDVVLGADTPFAAVDALSFESPSRRRLQQESDAMAWALDDVRKLHPRLPLAVFILPPTSSEAEIVRGVASKAFKGVGARMIDDELEMGRWAVRQIGRSDNPDARRAGRRTSSGRQAAKAQAALP